MFVSIFVPLLLFFVIGLLLYLLYEKTTRIDDLETRLHDEGFLFPTEMKHWAYPTSFVANMNTRDVEVYHTLNEELLIEYASKMAQKNLDHTFVVYKPIKTVNASIPTVAKDVK